VIAMPDTTISLGVNEATSRRWATHGVAGTAARLEPLDHDPARGL
jgi:hypothetical protein